MNRSDSIARKKAELQSRGVRIPPELVDELVTKYNAPALKSGRIVLCLESPRKDGGLISVFIVNGKRGAKSPLHMVRTKSGKYEIWVDDKKYTDITLIPRPRFYDRLTGNNTPMSKVAVIVGPGHMRSVVNQICTYHQVGKPCKFCAVQHWWEASLEKAMSQIAETVEAGVKEGVVEHVSLTTATTNSRGRGLDDVVDTARLIQSKVKLPLMAEFEPLSDSSLLESLLQEGRKAGITTVSCNIECFDENIRPEVMPLKGRIPVATYIEAWKKCIDIFGKNQVFTVVVVGIGEDDRSIMNGIEMAASSGVMTFLVPHSPAIGAVYEDMEPPSADRMLSLYERAVSIYQRYGLDILTSSAGCVRGGGFSAIKDVARFGV